jgi:hypothetical protein
MREHYKHKIKEAEQTQANIDRFIANGGKITPVGNKELKIEKLDFNHQGEKQLPDFDTVKKVESKFDDIHKRHFRR